MCSVGRERRRVDPPAGPPARERARVAATAPASAATPTPASTALRRAFRPPRRRANGDADRAANGDPLTNCSPTLPVDLMARCAPEKPTVGVLGGPALVHHAVHLGCEGHLNPHPGGHVHD